MFAPGHITGFFAIYKHSDKLKTGSTGAGITVDNGVSLELKEGRGNVFYNNEREISVPLKRLLSIIKNLDTMGIMISSFHLIFL